MSQFTEIFGASEFNERIRYSYKYSWHLHMWHGGRNSEPEGQGGGRTGLQSLRFAAGFPNVLPVVPSTTLKMNEWGEKKYPHLDTSLSGGRVVTQPKAKPDRSPTEVSNRH